MATPENILARYRTYSYHHILIACDSTTTATTLQNKGLITELQRSREVSKNGDDKFAGMSIAGGPGDNYVVLIDSLVDSEFYINSCGWSTIISPSGTGQQTMAQLDGQLEIFEPYGAMFLERLVDLTDTLGTDPTGLVFLLKTVFIGYNDDHHRHKQEMIPNVKPFMFNLVNITSVINETGSSYTMEVVGAQNGYGKLPHVTNIAKGFSLELDTGDTLAIALGKVEQELNDEYADFAESLGLDFAKGDSGEFVNAGRFRPVRYVIEASDYDNSGFLAGTNEQDRNTTTPGKVSLQFAKGQNIEGIIKKVMESSSGVLDEATKEDRKAIFKINSFLRSTPTEVVVEYQVSRYEMVIATVDELSQKQNVDLGDAPNVRTYDYIFTGNNIDIIEFDIKMDMGLSFFHTAANTSYSTDQINGKSGGEDTNITTAPGTTGSNATKTNKPLGKTPLFLGDKMENPKVRNKKNPVALSGFNALLTRHAAIENIGVTMKIHGDPSLMSEMLVTDVTDQINATTKKSFMTAPALIKVNIKMPNHANNPTSFRTFWYDGYYILHSVDTSFDDGEFTQVLTMFSVPVSSAIDNKTDANEPTDTNVAPGKGGPASADDQLAEDTSVESFANHVMAPPS